MFSAKVLAAFVTMTQMFAPVVSRIFQTSSGIIMDVSPKVNARSEILSIQPIKHATNVFLHVFLAQIN